VSDFSLLHADYFTFLFVVSSLPFLLLFLAQKRWACRKGIARFHGENKRRCEKLEFYGEYETICSRLRSRLLSILCLIFYLFTVSTFADSIFFFILFIASFFLHINWEIMWSGSLTRLVVQLGLGMRLWLEFDCD